jgi:hypothetical protein
MGKQAKSSCTFERRSEKIKEEDDVNEVIVTEHIVVDLYKNHANKFCPPSPTSPL